MSASDDLLAELQAIREECEAAASAVMGAAEAGLRATSRARAGEAAALDEVDGALLEALQACAFQDVTGQRLAKVVAALSGAGVPTDPLLKGPELKGEGLGQADVDALFD